MVTPDNNLNLRLGKQRQTETLFRTSGVRVRQQSYPETDKLREILQLWPEVPETVPHHQSGADTAHGGHQQAGHFQACGHGRSLWHQSHLHRPQQEPLRESVMRITTILF